MVLVQVIMGINLLLWEGEQESGKICVCIYIYTYTHVHTHMYGSLHNFEKNHDVITNIEMLHCLGANM